MRESVLVTGATGRLGRALLPRLTEMGYKVRGMSRTMRSGGDVDWVTADLTTGYGLAAALTDVHAVVHLAAAPYKRKYTDHVELDGTRRLAEVARERGVAHLLYVSIIGADQIPWGYFRTKVRAEEIVSSGRVPWSIVRAAQFHEFMDQAFSMAARAGLMIADPGIRAQPVDVRDVASHLIRRLQAGPSGETEDFGGPEVLAFDEAARQWLEARGKRRPLVRMKVPGKLGATFRGDHLVTDATPTGTITWKRYLQEQLT
ncbi:SDR family oxidoreductase [Nonomuraea sp. CA-141351]|uniref:SDR family oxidoreductase n=1 Tax=Nonomuraea sp. CA-141351 TaxID=3239996 RepID=UPI003D906E64